MIRRRAMVLGAGFALVASRASAWAQPSRRAWRPPETVRARLGAMETRLGGRLGLFALDAATNHIIAHREQERFAMCSSFKWLLAAAVLRKANRGDINLDTLIPYTRADLLPHSPVTEAHVGEGGLPVETLCAAAVEQSDNCAANLLLARIDGPAGLTAFLRENGDSVTRLDRTELSLNENALGDPRDTTMPAAMVATMQALLLGDVLAPASRMLLMDWLVGCQTGLDRLRAGLPQNWRAGDKTGTGGNGAVVDLAIAFPPQRSPILIACMMSETTAPLDQCVAAQAEIARLVAETFGA